MIEKTKPQIFRPFFKDPVISEKSKFYFETSSFERKVISFLIPYKHKKFFN